MAPLNCYLKGFIHQLTGLSLYLTSLYFQFEVKILLFIHPLVLGISDYFH